MLLQRMISENCVDQGTVIVLFGPQSYVKQGPTVYKEESSHSILFTLLYSTIRLCPPYVGPN